MNIKEIDDTKLQAAITPKVDPEIQLFESLYVAKQALKKSSEILNSEESTQLQKLRAFATAMKAEISIDVLTADPGDMNLWECKYRAATELEGLLRRCESQARLEAEKTRKEVYTTVMAQLFESIPDDVREEMSVELTADGWEFSTEY